MKFKIVAVLLILWSSTAFAQNAEVNFLNELVRIEQNKAKDASQLRGKAFATLVEERTKEVGNFEANQDNFLQIFSNLVNYESVAAVFAYANIKDKSAANWLLNNLPKSDMNTEVFKKAISNYTGKDEKFKYLLPPENSGFAGKWSVLYSQLYTLQQTYKEYYANPNNQKFEEAHQLFKQGKFDLALPKLQELDKANYGKASYLLGLLYKMNTKAVTKDTKKSFELVKKAADLNVPEANNELSVYYAYGIGTPSNPDKSLEYHHKAVQLKDASALYIEQLKNSGEKNGKELYMKAMNTTDAIEKKRLLQQSALSHYGLALAQLVKDFESEPETINETFFWSVYGSLIREPRSLMRYQTYDDVTFQLLLGLNGIHFYKDNFKIEELAYQVASDIYKDKARTFEALDWFLIAERLGNKDCYYEIGVILLDEKGKFYNKENGLKFMEAAHKNGHPLAKFYLEKMK
jgi:TPR repeat protein